jgi:hypothetical protein
MNTLIFQYLIAAIFSMAHPYYISMTEIEHDKTAGSIEVSVRIFTDDFENAIRKTYPGKVDLLNKNNKPASEQLIQQYINKHLTIKADGKTLNLKFDGFEKEEGSIWSYFECDNITAVATIEVTNTILYDYKQEQVNFIHVKAGSYDATTKLNYPDNYKKFSIQ